MSIIHQSSNTKPSLPCTIFSKPPLQNAFSGLSVCALHCEQRVSDLLVGLVVWWSKKQKTNSEGQAWWVSCSSEAFLQAPHILLFECFQLCSHHKKSMSVLVVSKWVFTKEHSHAMLSVVSVVFAFGPTRALHNAIAPASPILLSVSQMSNKNIWNKSVLKNEAIKMIPAMPRVFNVVFTFNISLNAFTPSSSTLLSVTWHQVVKIISAIVLDVDVSWHTPKSQRCQCCVDFQWFTQCLCPFISNVVPCCLCSLKSMSKSVIQKHIENECSLQM